MNCLGFAVLTAALTLSTAHAADQAVNVNASFNIQAPITAPTDIEISAQEQKLKRAMYERATRECADIVATIATTCVISNISVSTQINQNPGQAPTIYVNLNVSMQVRLR